MINNLELIKPLLKFESDDDFYYLQILQRKKDPNPIGLGLGTSNNARTIKNYFISNVEYLERKMPEIIALCNLFNARASIRLNKRSYKKVGYRALQKIANTMANGEFEHLKSSYSKACGTGHNAGKNKTWVIDIDKEDLDKFEDLIAVLTTPALRPEGEKIIATIPSKTRLHLITKPFDIKQFKESGYVKLTGLDKLEIHKDNPTNLYIP